MRQLWDKIVQFKDRLKKAVSSTVYREEKPSIMAQLKKYEKVATETQKPEPSTLTDLYERFDAALKNLRQVDARLKSANGAAKYDKILPERHNAYSEYSALKLGVKKAEASLSNRKPQSRDMGR